MDTVEKLNNVPVFNPKLAKILIRKFRVEDISENRRRDGSTVFYFKDNPEVRKIIDDFVKEARERNMTENAVAPTVK